MKKRFGVKEVAAMSGISIRTLHYYDKIALLKPASRTEAGYRFYEESELLRLQQILFYRELGFKLKEIRDVLDDAEFDLVQALENHQKQLIQRKDRISTLLNTIQNTIKQLKSGEIMSKPEMLYEGLPEEFGNEYRQEAIDAYGKEAIEKSEKELMKLGKKGFDQLKNDLDRVTKELFELRNENPESEEVQQRVANHYEIIRKFWGTPDEEDKQAEAYAGLGGLYVSDERFLEMDGKPQPEFALFMEKAMGHYARTSLEG